MPHRLLIPELRELLADKDQAGLREALEQLHPHDAAEALAGLEPDEIVEVMSALPVLLERDMFEYFEPELQEAIVLGSGRDRVGTLLSALSSDERAEFMDRLDSRVRKQLMPLLARAAREDLVRRDQYEPDQVGSILSTEYCKLGRDLTAKKAIKELRRQEPKRETIYYSYVTDDDGKLIGFVSLRDLLVAPDNQTVGEIMRTDPVAVSVTDDQEDAARLIREYDVIALPVVDENQKLVGIVTYDDAADIEEQEGTEDIERMAGIGGEAEVEFSDEGAISLIRRRGPLLWALALAFLLTSLIIAAFDKQLKSFGPLGALVIALLPFVMAIGGMVGTQASSLVIRALTTGSLEARSLWIVVWKELRVSFGIGFVLAMIAIVNGAVIGFTRLEPGQAFNWWVCFGAAIAMILHVLVSGIMGATIPIVAFATGRDPAMVSTPAVTFVADLSGASIYLLTMTLLLSPAA